MDGLRVMVLQLPALGKKMALQLDAIGSGQGQVLLGQIEVGRDGNLCNRRSEYCGARATLKRTCA